MEMSCNRDKQMEDMVSFCFPIKENLSAFMTKIVADAV